MAGEMMSDTRAVPKLIAAAREPVAASKSSGTVDMGEQTLQDCVMVLLALWAFLIILVFSLRGHNI